MRASHWIILPLALFVIFMLIYFQFKSIPTTLLVFSGIFVAWCGGFLLIWQSIHPSQLCFALRAGPLQAKWQSVCCGLTWNGNWWHW